MLCWSASETSFKLQRNTMCATINIQYLFEIMLNLESWCGDSSVLSNVVKLAGQIFYHSLSANNFNINKNKQAGQI